MTAFYVLGIVLGSGDFKMMTACSLLLRIWLSSWGDKQENCSMM